MNDTKQAKAYITVNTRVYQRSHMKQPRGRGSWAFRIDGVPDLFWTPGNTLYGEAVQMAKAVAHKFNDAAGYKRLTLIEITTQP